MASSDSSSVSLPVLYCSVLSDISVSLSHLSTDAATQELIQRAAANLKLIAARVSVLSLFSENELLEDISTRNLVYLSVPYVNAEVEDRIKPEDHQDRLKHLIQARKYLDEFYARMEMFEVIPASDVGLASEFRTLAGRSTDRREIKIKQFKLNKDLGRRVEAMQHRRGLSTSDTSPNVFDIVSTLLPSSATEVTEVENDAAADEDFIRETTILVLRLLWADGLAKLASIDEESSLLRSIPPEFNRPTDYEAPHEEDGTWKLDTASTVFEPAPQGPLLDAAGKPLRAFTILPSNSRTQMQAGVFRPDHRLPTMSVDDYLEEEQRRGNIVSDGGAASAERPTSSEQLAIDSEMDGTLFSEQKSEEKRRKDEVWAVFTDANPRGAGNTMNRG